MYLTFDFIVHVCVFFVKIPELQADIKIPDYCCLSTERKEEGLTASGDEEGSSDQPNVKINAWFGPAGTVSPLHFDPDHNLLAQVTMICRIIIIIMYVCMYYSYA